MKKVVLGLFVAAVVLMGAVSAQAQVFKLSLWDSICIPNEAYTGGVEIGIGSDTEKVEGVQFDFIYSRAGSLSGVQFGLVSNVDEGKGVQLGLLNMAKQFTGIQWAAVNVAFDNFTGAQLGWVNYAKQAKGLQLGFVNWTDSMEGIQLGLVNVIKNNKQFLPVCIIFNFCFK